MEIIQFQSKQNRRYDIGNRIASLRRRAGLTQKELAKALDCSESRVSLIECWKRTPTLSELEDAARIFKVHPLFMIHGLSPEACEMVDFIESMPPGKRRPGVRIFKAALETAMATEDLRAATPVSLAQKA